jgi:hypothetical protein
MIDGCSTFRITNLKLPFVCVIIFIRKPAEQDFDESEREKQRMLKYY